MKLPPWTVALAGAGLVSLPGLLLADETPTTSTVAAALSTTTLSGYVDTSAQWNLGTGNINVPNYAFGGPSKADGFNLNVVKISLEKPIDPKDGWAAGYKVDLLAGPDANALFTQSSGVTGDFGVKQAYVALHAPVGNGLDFKVGVWDTIIGYEVFESGSNPNFTRSYGYTIEPTTHTGIQASYQVCDAFVANVGIADSFGSTINGRSNPPKAESYKTYMGSFTFTAPTNTGFIGGSTVSACVINGYNAALGVDETSYYIGGTMNTPITALKVGACYDYLGVSSQPLGPAAYANVVGLYASYQITEKMALFGRGEYATSDLAFAGTGGPGTGSGLLSAHRVIEGTVTLQYDLWKNVLSRLEFRWDHAADGSTPYGGTSVDSTPSKKNSFILAANVIYKF